ncbi:MAG: FtsX-like permease family protein [Fibrobacter sp.]|nr:FtsX-like permease family protein [Fibrobacter sp.]
MLFSIFQTAFKNILRNRMRTLLTVLGIVIGVGAVIIMVAVGKGSEATIQKQIESMGTNLLMVYPRAFSSGGVRMSGTSRTSLKLKDVQSIKEQSTLLQGVSGRVRLNEQVIAEGKNWNTSIEGVNPDYQEIRDWHLAHGDFFDDYDVRQSRKVAVLGATTAQELFGDASVAVGKKIRIRTVPFTVIGVLQSKGASGPGGDQDDVIMAPLNTVYYRLSGRNFINDIYVSAVSIDKMNEAQAELEDILRRIHRIKAGQNDDFMVRNQSDILSTATDMTKTFTLLLSAIAGISLLVGGIGIMNIMLVSVTERNREIGIRMALGARGKDILLQFLIESVVLCVLGGLLGIAFALAVCYGLEKWTEMTTVIDSSIMLIAFSFSAAVGIFFGYYPASKAAKLNPIDALRYE